MCTQTRTRVFASFFNTRPLAPQAREVRTLELLKMRFGENAMHACEVRDRAHARVYVCVCVVCRQANL